MASVTFDDPTLNWPKELNTADNEPFRRIIERMAARMGGPENDIINGLVSSTSTVADRVPLTSVEVETDYTTTGSVIVFAKSNLTVYCNADPANLETFIVKRVTTAGNVVINGNGKLIDLSSTYTMLLNLEARKLTYYADDDVWYLI